MSTMLFRMILKVWCNAHYLLHKEINSHESRFNLFGLLTNSTQRIYLVARAGLERVTFRSQSQRFPSTPHMSTKLSSSWQYKCLSHVIRL